MRVPVVLVAAALAAACGHRGTARPVKLEVASPGTARVVLREVDGDILKFKVWNTASGPLTLDRDAVRLRLPDGTMLPRLSGGLKSTYIVPPGGVHDLNVRFDFRRAPHGADVLVLFDGAVLVNGTPVPVEPMPFKVFED